jgi:hypothetical protein
MQTEVIATYKGGTFRENLLAYSKERMKRDVPYKKAVMRTLTERRRARVAVQKEATASA